MTKQMTKEEAEMLDTIIRKIETLQRRLKDDKAKARLGNARIELVRLVRVEGMNDPTIFKAQSEAG